MVGRGAARLVSAQARILRNLALLELRERAVEEFGVTLPGRILGQRRQRRIRRGLHAREESRGIVGGCGVGGARGEPRPPAACQRRAPPILRERSMFIRGPRCGRGALIGPLAEDGVNQKTRNHDQHTEQRLQRPLGQEIVHHEAGHEQENQRRYRVSPGAVGPRQIGMGDAQLDDAEHGEERAEQQRELDEVEHRLEAAREQHQARDRELKQDGIGRRAAGRSAGEQAAAPECPRPSSS